jgi:hypothetical protein
MVLIILGGSVVVAQDRTVNPTTACSQGHLTEVARVGQFVFRSYYNNNNYESCLQVIQSEKIIFTHAIISSGGHTLGQRGNNKLGVPTIANGTDITRRGRPNMIVSFHEGGAHCCTNDFVFELEPDFRLLATLNAQDTEMSYFADLDHNQHYYYLAEDWTFAGWLGSYVGSPFHSVILHYINDKNGGGFHLAIDKMKAPAPTSKEWQKALVDVRRVLLRRQSDVPYEIQSYLWQKVLDLIYTGHSDLAWKFLDEVGPEAQLGDNPKLEYFCSVLKSSPYWSDLEPTLKDIPPACANAKPLKGKP